MVASGAPAQCGSHTQQRAHYAHYKLQLAVQDQGQIIATAKTGERPLLAKCNLVWARLAFGSPDAPSLGAVAYTYVAERLNCKQG